MHWRRALQLGVDAALVIVVIALQGGFAMLARGCIGPLDKQSVVPGAIPRDAQAIQSCSAAGTPAIGCQPASTPK